jgi:hypothetical protein
MSGSQVNVGSFFRSLYERAPGSHTAVDYSGFQAFAAHIWVWIVVAGYVLSIIGFFVIVYATVRIFELRKREHLYYTTLIAPTESAGGVNSRWQHIQSLASETSASHWREAIIEADIMLDNLLEQQGYVGDGVGEKLKAVEPSSFGTLQEAWEAHKVRNQIAHEGSAFNLSKELAQRTIARYEAVFRELKAI